MRSREVRRKECKRVKLSEEKKVVAADSRTKERQLYYYSQREWCVWYEVGFGWVVRCYWRREESEEETREKGGKDGEKETENERTPKDGN